MTDAWKSFFLNGWAPAPPTPSVVPPGPVVHQPADSANATAVYPDNQLAYEGNLAQYGGIDRVPMFFYWMGDVQYKRDKAGNLIAGNVTS